MKKKYKVVKCKDKYGEEYYVVYSRYWSTFWRTDFSDFLCKCGVGCIEPKRFDKQEFAESAIYKAIEERKNLRRNKVVARIEEE